MVRITNVYQVLNMAEKPTEAPGTDVLEETEEDQSVKTPWCIILYDDDIHTFDEVINQLIKALGCSVHQAEKLTLQVHKEGKATVYEGTFEECLKVNSVLQEIQLITEIKG